MRPAALLLVASTCALATGCGPVGSSVADDGGGGASSDGGACVACVTDEDCAGALCAQLGSDSYCASACDGSGACGGDRACVGATTVNGKSVQVCVPRGDECGASPGADAGSSGGDSGVPYDGGGPPPSGQVGPGGGKLSRLYFAVVGDTRPANYDDTAGYPTAIITRIFSDLQALSPRPPFALSTGDYQFASSGSNSQAGAQIDIYEQARARYSGVLFPAMGNHECTGATASNCGPGSANGTTANYSAFLQKMLAPIKESLPYYAIRVDAVDGSWTSKFVFIAANAWSSAQASWLQATLAQPTTYTFLVRHEPASASTAPGVTPSEQIMAKYPYTLCIVGHSHTYYHYTGREVLIGNGGAPLTSKDYGFGLFSQRGDGAIVVDMINWNTGLSDSQFHFVVKADGSATH